jgi:hypothetical protein
MNRNFLLPILGLLYSLLMSSAAVATPIFYSNPSCYDAIGHSISCNGINIDMQNFGGPVMTGTTNIVNIWYGYSSLIDPTINTLGNFFGNLTGSEYLNIASLYGASTALNFQGNFLQDTSVYGTYLSNAALGSITKDASTLTGIPDNNNTIVFIYTAPGIGQQKDNLACGFHSDVLDGASDLKYAWIGAKYANPNSGCGAGTFTQNTNLVASHELLEALTDPLVGQATVYGPPLGWYDGGNANQGEIGDPCNGSALDTTLNGSSYRVQSIYVNDPSYAVGGMCTSGNTILVASVPEPESLGLFALGLAAIRFSRRKKS